MEKKTKYRLKDGEVEKIIKGGNELPSGAEALTHDEFFGSKSQERPLDDTDDDEGSGEGLGDGKMGRAEDGAE